MKTVKNFWMIPLLVISLMSIALQADPTGNERRTISSCASIKDKIVRQRCKACTLGRGKHFHPRRNSCHRNQGQAIKKN